MQAAPAAVLLLAVLATSACATTRVSRMGPLPGSETLVTLVVSAQREVVQQECRDVPALGPVLGCTLWRRLRLADDTPVTVMKVVRYVDAVPSPLSLEIDVHELCHVVAALQPIHDPCHLDNGGLVGAAALPAGRAATSR